MRSTTSKHFSEIPRANIQRSQFDRSSGLKTAFNSGDLVPVFCDEALPGDTFNLRMSTFARMSTPIFPILDNLYLDSFFFAVPLRLIWDDFKACMGEQTDPGDSIDFTVPQMTTPGGVTDETGSGTLSDFIGIPPSAVDCTHNSLHHRAYNLIWNEWFRSEDLQDSVVVDTDAGPDDDLDYVLLKRGKRHDYFTSCLPSPQKGSAVSLPLGATAPVVATTDNFPQWKMSGTGATVHLRPTSNSSDVLLDVANEGTSPLWWERTALEADLSSATSATINAIRQAFQIQKLLERDARGGTRYTEIVRSHFGVVSPDARLQRPEYLGGGTQQINFTPIPNTSNAASGVVGDQSAYVTSSGSNHSFVKSFTEHCVIIGMVSVRADLTYQQGLHRMFSRQTRYDFYWPEFAHLGEQNVLNQEIYAVGVSGAAQDIATFGYQERYAEYRYAPSRVTGKMRSTAFTPLDAWHVAQEFSSLPTLNDTFIQENPPVDRIVAVVDANAPQFYFDAYFKLKCARPMPTYSVPGLIDHF